MSPSGDDTDVANLKAKRVTRFAVLADCGYPSVLNTNKITHQSDGMISILFPFLIREVVRRRHYIAPLTESLGRRIANSGMQAAMKKPVRVHTHWRELEFVDEL